MIQPTAQPPESDCVEVRVTHHYKANSPVPFLPSWLPLTFDVILTEDVRFDNVELGTESSGLQPYAQSRSYGDLRHLDDDGLTDDERVYSGSISNRWSYVATVPTNLMVAVAPNGSSTAMMSMQGQSNRPFGSVYDLDDGSLEINPNIELDKILYIEPDDPSSSLQDLPEELGGDPELRRVFVHRIVEQFIDVLSRSENLIFQHAEAQQFYQRFIATSRYRKALERRLGRPQPDALPPITPTPEPAPNRDDTIDLNQWLG